MKLLFSCVLLVLAALAAPALDEKKDEKKELVIKDIVVGTGRMAAIDNRVTVHYTGWLAADGTEFDSSHQRGRPVSFRLGQGEVIKGWDRGILGMKVGGKRRLTVPPELAYGKRGAGKGAVPPNATLIFEIELMRVE